MWALVTTSTLVHLELVSAVPEDAADDKKQEFFLIFFKKTLFRQRFFFTSGKVRNDDRKEHVDDIVFSFICSFSIFCHVHAVRTRCMPTDRSNGNLHK